MTDSPYMEATNEELSKYLSKYVETIAPQTREKMKRLKPSTKHNPLTKQEIGTLTHTFLLRTGLSNLEYKCYNKAIGAVYEDISGNVCCIEIQFILHRADKYYGKEVAVLFWITTITDVKIITIALRRDIPEDAFLLKTGVLQKPLQCYRKSFFM